ncbi:MAG: class I SAM-dependent methyltransferase [Clostridia bacterium]|nr:class I SAM-dependent methyltransferase [Clostridia bacterium]
MAGYGDFAYYYDLLTGNVDYESRCDYIGSLLAENGIGKGILLDLACGTGTVSLLMSKKGYDVIGVDASEEMLSQAQEKKMEEGADIIFLCQKMEELDLFGTINAAVSTLDSINHVTDEEKLKEIFRRVSLFMEDEGIFVFDVNTPYKHRKILGDNTFVYDMEDVYCVWQNSTDESLLTQVSLDIFERDTECDEDDVYYRYSEEFCEKGYCLDKIKEYLEDNKFEVLAVYEEMTRETVSENTERAVFVAKKHGTQ